MCPLGAHLWMELVVHLQTFWEGSLANLLHDALLHLTAGAPRVGALGKLMPGVGQLACILLYISVIYHKQGVMAFPMSKTI